MKRIFIALALFFIVIQSYANENKVLNTMLDKGATMFVDGGLYGVKFLPSGKIEETWSGDTWIKGYWKPTNSFNKFEITYENVSSIQYLEIDFINKLWKIKGVAENGTKYQDTWEIIAWDILQ